LLRDDAPTGVRSVRRQPVQHSAARRGVRRTQCWISFRPIEESVVYAVVKAGGTQHKVGVGDTFTVNRLTGQAGDTVTLPALLLVDGDTVTTDAQALAGVTVTGEIV
jgi:hypothetical protein